MSHCVFRCYVDRVKLHVPPIRAQRAHCFIFDSTVPSEMDYFSRFCCLYSKYTILIYACTHKTLSCIDTNRVAIRQKDIRAFLLLMWIVCFQMSCRLSSVPHSINYSLDRQETALFLIQTLHMKIIGSFSCFDCLCFKFTKRDAQEVQRNISENHITQADGSDWQADYIYWLLKVI